MDYLKVALTAIFSAAELFIIAKFMGHKQISELDLFDYISGITVGSIAAELATEIENPLKPAVAMIIYGIISIILSVLQSKFPRSRKYINGTPTILMNNGIIYRENMKKAKLDLSEFMMMCRQAGYFNLESIQTAVYEYNGKLSILPVTKDRPATPADMDLSPKQETIFTEIIMDGRILWENLSRLGLDQTWLDNQLKNKGINSAKEVFLAVCDNTNNLNIYKNTDKH